MSIKSTHRLSLNSHKRPQTSFTVGAGPRLRTTASCRPLISTLARPSDDHFDEPLSLDVLLTRWRKARGRSLAWMAFLESTFRACDGRELAGMPTRCRRRFHARH